MVTGERLEDVLDRCIEEVRAGRSIEECLADWPQYEELGSLLRVASRLIAMPESTLTLSVPSTPPPPWLGRPAPVPAGATPPHPDSFAGRTRSGPAPCRPRHRRP